MASTSSDALNHSRGRRLAPLLRALGSVAVLANALTWALAAPAGASASSDRSRITQLEQRIAAQGAALQNYVAQYDQAAAHEAAIQARIKTDDARLATDLKDAAATAAKLRTMAIHAYVTGITGGSATVPFFTASNVSTALVQTEFMDVAGARLNDAIDAWRQDEYNVHVATTALHAQQAQAQATLAVLTSDRNAAQAALGQDETALGQAKGNLAAVLAAIAQQQAAQQVAQEQAIAQAAAAQQANAAAAQASSQVIAAPGTYANPLRGVGGLNPERIDQGVDFSGYGPIYAIGDGVVLNTFNAGWPGGTFIAYQLSDGPAAGLVVYAAEDIFPTVQVGETVTPNTVIGTLYEGPDGMETGWADPSAMGSSMANAFGQFSGSNTSAFGYNFSLLLQSVGAPGGVPQNYPPTGYLPPGWPAF